MTEGSPPVLRPSSPAGTPQRATPQARWGEEEGTERNGCRPLHGRRSGAQFLPTTWGAASLTRRLRPLSPVPRRYLNGPPFRPVEERQNKRNGVDAACFAGGVAQCSLFCRRCRYSAWQCAQKYTLPPRYACRVIGPPHTGHTPFHVLADRYV